MLSFVPLIYRKGSTLGHAGGTQFEGYLATEWGAWTQSCLLTPPTLCQGHQPPTKASLLPWEVDSLCPTL